MPTPDCSHVSATDATRPTGADYIYCLAKEVRELKRQALLFKPADFINANILGGGSYMLPDYIDDDYV